MVTILVPPEISPFEFNDNPIDAGDFTSISCIISKGDFPLGISWKHNNYTISPVDGITVTRTSKRLSQLTIDSVQASHMGEYTCYAKNKAGQSSHTAVLNVNGIFKALVVDTYTILSFTNSIY